MGTSIHADAAMTQLPANAINSRFAHDEAAISDSGTGGFSIERLVCIVPPHKNRLATGSTIILMGFMEGKGFVARRLASACRATEA
jgi:hypothetical protein